jgi:hypothetical protein
LAEVLEVWGAGVWAVDEPAVGAADMVSEGKEGESRSREGGSAQGSEREHTETP